MIIKLTKETYSLVNLDTGNIDYTNYTREDIINLSKENQFLKGNYEHEEHFLFTRKF